MAEFRALSLALGVSSDEEEPRPEEISQNSIALGLDSVPRTGTRDVFVLKQNERNKMLGRRRRNQVGPGRGEVPRGEQRLAIQRDNRVKRIQFKREMTSDEVILTFKDAFCGYRIEQGRRRVRPTNTIVRQLLRSATTRAEFYKSTASGHAVERLAFHQQFPTGQELLAAYSRSTSKIYVYLYANQETEPQREQPSRSVAELVRHRLTPNAHSTPVQVSDDDIIMVEPPTATAGAEGEQRDDLSDTVVLPSNGAENQPDEESVNEESEDNGIVVDSFQGSMNDTISAINEEEVATFPQVGEYQNQHIFDPIELRDIDPNVDDLICLTPTMDLVSELPELSSLDFEMVCQQSLKLRKILVIIVFDNSSVATIQRTLQGLHATDCIFWCVSLDSSEFNKETVTGFLDNMQRQNQIESGLARAKDTLETVERRFDESYLTCSGCQSTQEKVTSHSAACQTVERELATGQPLHPSLISVACQASGRKLSTSEVAVETDREEIATPRSMAAVLRQVRKAKVPAQPDHGGIKVSARGRNGVTSKIFLEGTTFQGMYDYIGSKDDQPLYFQLVTFDGKIVHKTERIFHPVVLNIKESESDEYKEISQFFEETDIFLGDGINDGRGSESNENCEET
eukprot:gene1179-550_t